jgi:hypothetical protein
MRRKRLQEIANNLGPILAARLSPDDLEVLAGFADGVVTIELLEGKAQHGQADSFHLNITGELKDWLQEQLRSASIPAEGILTAQLEVDINTARVRTDRKRIILFEIEIRSTIATDEKTYSNAGAGLRWHQRPGP